ncbi:FtsK/SpoIIIE domain-containing protein [uncultured Mobiluncus sp.]|uniref:FtsK/SpoIIIE domain-containing protein n=1 Tax=uncultured Mobiluncus sp. TaxID=293425 RepID=UPI0025E9C466|nr:FtsK/SpoIIIE domain-containing protein [uncultured Mobiluncus sp.]
MRRPVRILVEGNPTEVLLNADARARVADVATALGGGPTSRLTVTPLAPLLDPGGTGSLPVVAESSGSQVRRGEADGAVPAQVGKPYVLSRALPLAKAPIPPGAGLALAGDNAELPPAPAGMKSLLTYSPQPVADPEPLGINVEMPARPRLWLANPATLAVPVVPVALFGVLAVIFPSVAAFALLGLAVVAGGAEVGWALTQNRAAWVRYERDMAALTPQIHTALEQRDAAIRASVTDLADPRHALLPGLWGHASVQMRIPVGFTQVRPEITLSSPADATPFRGWGPMAGPNAETGHPTSGQITAINRRISAIGAATVGEGHTGLEVAYVPADCGPLAVTGSGNLRGPALNQLLIRAALRYSPADLKIVVAGAKPEKWAWVSNLPHGAAVREDLELEPVSDLSETSAERLAQAWASRKGQRGSRQRLLLVVDGEVPAGSRWEDFATEPGVWLVNAVDDLNSAVSAARQVLDLATGSWQDGVSRIPGAVPQNQRHTASNGIPLQSARPSQMSVEPLLLTTPSARKVAELLANLKLPGKTAEPLPVVAQLTDVYPLATGENAAVLGESGDSSRCAAAIGYGTAGPVTLDLADGKNAIVAGENQAARTNVIAAYLAGLALTQRPEDVSWIIFDSRGTKWGELGQAPHCLGIEPGRGDAVFARLLRYLEAETERREIWLRESGAGSLARARGAKIAGVPADLIVVIAVGEAFTSRQLSQLAERLHMYRALGLHLLVSSGDTEKLPREALKYLPTRVVLHLEDAALEMVCGSFEIDPHSAFAQSGRGVLLVGGVATGFQTLNTLMTTDFTDPQLAPVKFTALGGAAFPPALSTGGLWRVPALAGRSSSRAGTSGDQPGFGVPRAATPLSMLAGSFYRGNSTIRRWTSGLEKVYDLAALGQSSDAEFRLGVRDDLGRQDVVPFGFSPDREGNLFVAGPRGSGRTGVLRAIAADSLNTGGRPVTLYVCSADPTLDVLSSWANVGVVAHANEPETIADTIEYLVSRWRWRTEIALRNATHSFPELREVLRGEQPGERNGAQALNSATPGQDAGGDAGKTLGTTRSTNPGATRSVNLVANGVVGGETDRGERIIVAIDGLEAVLESLPGASSASFLELITGGRVVGIHFVISAESVENLPAAWRGAFGMRIELNGSVPGRGLVADDPRAIQIAVLGNDPSEPAQTRILERLGTLAKTPAHRIDRLAVPVFATALTVAPKGEMALGLSAPGGRQINTITSGVYLIARGDGEVDRAVSLAVMRWLARSLRTSSPDTGMVLLSAQSREDSSPALETLAGLEIWDAVACGFADFRDFYHQLLSVAEQKSPPGFPGLAIFIADLPGFALNTDSAAAMTDVIRAARSRGHLVFASGAATSRDGMSWMTDSELNAVVKAPAAGLSLGLTAADTTAIFGVSVPQDGTVFPPARGYWIHRGQATKVQLPQENG